MNPVWIVNGIPGSGKTATARALCQRLGRAAHLQGDLLQSLIVAGGVWPGQEPEAESHLQIDLNLRNQCLLARSFHRAGIVPVIDYVVASGQVLDLYLRRLRPRPVRFVTLDPPVEVAVRRASGRGTPDAGRWAGFAAWMRAELGGRGLWLDNAALSVADTVEHLLAHEEAASIRS